VIFNAGDVGRHSAYVIMRHVEISVPTASGPIVINNMARTISLARSRSCSARVIALMRPRRARQRLDPRRRDAQELGRTRSCPC